MLTVLVNHLQFKRGKNHSVKDLSNISLFLAAFSSNFCFLFSASASFPSAFSANSDLGISKDDHGTRDPVFTIAFEPKCYKKLKSVNMSR